MAKATLKRQIIIDIVRNVFKEKGIEFGSMWSDKRTSTHPSNVYGNQMKFSIGCYKGEKNMGEAIQKTNEVLSRHELPFRVIFHTVIPFKRSRITRNYIKVLQKTITVA